MLRPPPLLALLLSLTLSIVSSAEDKVPVERTFADAATLHGDTYALTRDFLAGQGADILPFLARQRESKDWRKRRLARVLTLLIEDPEGGAVTRAKLASGAKAGAIPPEHEPLVTDYLWQRLPDIRFSPGPSRAVVRAIETAGRLGNLETTRALLHLGTRSPIPGSWMLDALARIGDKALPALRESVDSGDDRADAAIEVLARLRDPGSAPWLIRTLGREDRGRRQIAVARALAAIGDPAGLPPVLDAMARLVRTHRRHRSSYDYTYRRLRPSAVALAPGAGEFLEDASRSESLLEGALARGVLFEAREPDRAREFYTLLGEAQEAATGRQWPGRPEARPPEERGRDFFWRFVGHEPEFDAVEIPEALLLERAAAYGRIEDLRRVALLEEDDPGFGILAEALLARDRFRREPEPMRLLAGRYGARALGPMRELLEEPFIYYLADLIRETLNLGSEKAVPLLDEILLRAEAQNTNATRYRPHAALAEAVRSALTGPPDVLAGLLRHEDPGVREAAALALGRKGDPRAVAPLLRAAAAREGPRHVEAFSVLLSFGDAALDTLEPAVTDPDPRVALLAEVLVLFITRPEVVSSFPDPPERPAWHGRGARVPMLPRFRAHARVMADALGKEGVPLLEAEVTFSGDPRRIIHAALALAMLGRERSIEVLVRAGPGPWVDGKSLLAQALLEFGEKGIEAAKRIPAPDPALPGVSSRAGRHAGAAEALAHDKTPEGLEKILQGLASTVPAVYGKPDPMWTFLELAGQYRDPRLLDALLDLQRRKPRSYRSSISPLLGEYPHPRVAPVLVEIIEQSAHGDLETAARALERHAGSRACGILLARLDLKLSMGRRAAVATALGVLGSRERRDLLAALAYEKAVVPLIGVLEERSGASYRAAKALTAMTWCRRRGIVDRRTVEPLARWYATWKGHRLTFGWSYFIQPRDEEALRALLAAYLDSDRGNIQLAAVLGEQGFTEVVEDLTRDRKLEVLAKLGKPGLEALHGIFLTERRSDLQAHALELLRKKQHRIPFEEVMELLEPLVANGPWDPRFARSMDRIHAELVCLVRVAAAMAAWLDPERAHPILKSGAIASPDAAVREILAEYAAKVERAHPGLAGRPSPVAGIRPGGEGPVVRIELLESFDRFRAAAGAWTHLSQLDLDALTFSDMESLGALVELCHPPGPTPSADEVRRAVGLLDDPERREEAVPLLALSFYPAEWLPRDSAAARAIRDWRRDGPWFLIEWRKFHAAAAALARSRLSLGLMRDYARQNLDRLTRIRGPAHKWPKRTLLGHLFASLRMSPEPEDRSLLSDFPARAEDYAGAVAVYVMRPRGRGEDLPPWGKPPEHDYREGFLAALDPDRPATFRMAMRALSKDKSLRPRLREVLAAEATVEDLRLDVAEHLWREFGDAAARDYFIPRLLSPDRKVFRNAIRTLTARKAAGGSVCPHLAEVLTRGEEWRKIEVIRSLRGFYYSGRSVRAAGVTVAPFLTSESVEIRKAARKILLWLQESGWFDILGHLVKKHEDEEVRREAAALREQFVKEKAEKERERGR